MLSDPDEAFRILYNLMNNAVAVANRDAGSLRTVTIRADVEGPALTRCGSPTMVRGLPVDVRTKLFVRRAARASTPRHGYGLAIARELAEHNGGTLTLAPSTKGTTFVLKLPVLLTVLQGEPRHLGRRAMTL